MLTQQFLEIRENLKIALLNEALIKNPESQTKLKAMNPIHMILVGGGKYQVSHTELELELIDIYSGK